MTDDAAVARNRSVALLRRDRPLLRLLAGAAISGTGDWCYGVVLVVWITSRTDADPGWIAAATIGRLLPSALAAPLGGVLADRFDRRRILVLSSLLRAFVLLAVAWTVSTDGPLLLALGLVVAGEAIGAVHRPTVLSAIPSLVGEREAAAANATFGGLMQLSLLAGPAVAAVGLALATPASVLLITAGAFTVAAALIPPSVTSGSAGRAEPTPILRSLAEGFRGLREAPGVPAILALVVVSEFVFGAEGVAQVLIATERLGRPASVGILVAAVGLGGMLAAPLVPRVARRSRLVLPFVVANVLGGVPLMLLSLPRTVTGAAVILIVEGCGVIAYEVLLITLLQRVVRRDLLGRVFGLQGGLVIGSQVVGAVCAPFILRAFGLETGVVLLGGTLTLASLMLWTPMRTADAVAESYAQRWAPYVATLRTLSIFEPVPQALLEQVAASIEERDVRPGDVLIREGDTADALYVVDTGTFEAVTEDAAGGERILSRMGAGAWFGEIGLLGRRPRTATVRAVSSGTVWRIPGPVFLEAVEGGPAIADPLQRTMLRRLANHGGEAA